MSDKSETFAVGVVRSPNGSIIDRVQVGGMCIRKTANLLFLLFQAEKAGKAGKLRDSQAGSTAIKREKHESGARFS